MNNKNIAWFKVKADYFYDGRIILVESLRDGYIGVNLYFKLLAIAASSNENGALMLADTIPYTAESLATTTRFQERTIKKWMDVLIQSHLIDYEDGIYYISDWGETQSVDKLEEIRQKNRERQRKHREKIKAMLRDMENDKNEKLT